MKRILAAIMCAVMLVGLLASCTKKEDPGPELDIYIEQTTNFDPAMAYNDQAASQFLSLVYQGLTVIQDNGKIGKGMAEKWTVDGNVIEFKIKETRWSDGNSVDASDFVYAWKRILDPEFECDAASLLFYIENAVEVKNGDVSIDDVKIEATGTDYLTVTLIDECYVDEFLYNCASVALYPLRSDVLSKITVYDPYYQEFLPTNNELTANSWSTLNAVLVANGPFYVKKINMYEGDKYIILERNKYYLTDPEKEEALRKFVNPYRLNVVFTEDETEHKDVSTAMDLFKIGAFVYNGNIALDQRNSYKSEATVVDQLATYSYMFNTTNPLFADARVRQALSMAIDRTEIEKLVVFGKAADGLISPSVFYTDRKTDFRETVGGVISTKANVDGAKQLLKEAGVTGGEFTLSVRDDQVSKAVAEYVAGVWKSLGFTVTVQALGHKAANYSEVVGKDATSGEFKVEKVYSNLIKDQFNDLYVSREFDVIGIDYAMLSTDAFAALAKFGTAYSGGAYDFSTSADDFAKIPNVTGYASEEYDALIASVLKETDDAKRAELLKSAEAKLLADMPIAPLFYMQNAFVMIDDIKGVETGFFGYTDFTDAHDKAYEYKPVEALIPAKTWVID